MEYTLLAVAATAVAACCVLWHRLTRLKVLNAVLTERLEQQTANGEKQIALLEEKFKLLADEALSTTGRQSQKGLEAALEPMRQALDKFSGELTRRYIDDRSDRNVLKQGIADLCRLNEQVGNETRRLAQALKGNNATQGRWGEMILANILEHSGLERGRWVVYQECGTDPTGNVMRPDAVVHCPGSRDIIIDSKVSLTAYLGMLEEDDSERREALEKEHLRSIDNHLRQLSAKEYNTRLGKPDPGFVLMFVPHEGAYLAAMNADTRLWQRAYDRHVVIVSPTHLVSVIRLIEQMWRAEDQTSNTLAIADEAAKMLDQFNELLASVNAASVALDRSRDAVSDVARRLSTGNGNLVKRATRLTQLGVRTRKELGKLRDAQSD